MDVIKSSSLHSPNVDLATGAVKWRVDNAEVVMGLDRLGSQPGRQQSINVLLVEALIDDRDQVLSSLKLDVTHGADLIHLPDDILIMRCDDLGSILPVDLKSIVLARIVRGGHHPSALTAKVTDRIGDHRRGTKALEEVYPDAIGCKDISYDTRKGRTIVASIVADDHLKVSVLTKLLDHIIGETLSGSTDIVFIHTIGPGTHDAPHTSGAKLQIPVEGIDQPCRILCVQELLHLTARLLIIVLREPLLSPLSCRGD